MTSKYIPSESENKENIADGQAAHLQALQMECRSRSNITV